VVPPQQSASGNTAEPQKYREEVIAVDPAQAEAQFAAIVEQIPHKLKVSLEFGEYQHEQRGDAGCIADGYGSASKHMYNFLTDVIANKCCKRLNKLQQGYRPINLRFGALSFR
jgi:hypothetical protein